MLMQKFKASGLSVQVNGPTILSFVKGIPSSKENVLSILSRHGINDPKEGSWHPQQSWLNAFKEFDLKPAILRSIGKAIIVSAKFPPEVKDGKTAFETLDKAYHMNHRGGEIGYYKLKSYDVSKRIIVIECNTPYPEKFDEGILIGLWEKYKPTGAIVLKPVEIKGNVFTLSW